MSRANIVIMLVGASVFGCRASQPPKASEPAPSTTTLLTVDTATVELPFSFPAQLYVENDAVVYARSKGIVDSVYVDLGSVVAQGQLLAKLESVDQEIALARAREVAEDAERTARRQREMDSLQMISTEELEKGETARRQAVLAVRQAERDLELTKVRATFRGAITARSVRAGRMVVEGDSLFRVTAMAPVRASVRVPEGAGNTMRVGDEASVIGLDGKAASAKVIRASPAVDPASGTRELLLQLTSGTGMKPGSNVTVRMGREKRLALAIPAQAVAEQGYVLVWENGRTSLRAVTLGATLEDGRYEVVSGLSPSERVVSVAR